MTLEERVDFAIETIKQFDADHYANVDKGWRRLSAISEKNRGVVGEINFFENLRDQQLKERGEKLELLEV